MWPHEDAPLRQFITPDAPYGPNPTKTGRFPTARFHCVASVRRDALRTRRTTAPRDETRRTTKPHPSDLPAPPLEFAALDFMMCYGPSRSGWFPRPRV